MKKRISNYTFLLILIFGFNLSSLNAQEGLTEKGTIFLKASSDLNISFSKGLPLDLSVGGGYFFFDNIAIGADINLSKFSDDFATTLRAFGRYYLKDKYFGGLGVQSYSFDGETNLLFDLEVGYMHPLTDNIIIEPTLNLVDFENLNLNVSLSIYF